MDIAVDAVISSVPAALGRHQIEFTLRNTGKEAVLIDPFNLCGKGHLQSPLFIIIDGKGKEVEYTGRIYKRGQPNFTKFYTLKGGSKISQKCALDKAYNFNGTSPPYKIKYSVFNMHPKLGYFEIDSIEHELKF